MKEPTIEEMVKELKKAGWREWSRGMSMWKAPWGAMYRGPHLAWHVMKRIPMCEAK